MDYIITIMLIIFIINIIFNYYYEFFKIKKDTKDNLIELYIEGIRLGRIKYERRKLK